MRCRGKRPAPCRAGMTMLEFLVVIAVLGTLMGLLIPAVQASREAARRTQCPSNIRQIMLAARNHLDTHDVFPCPAMERESWNVRILPYLEEPKPVTDSSGIVLSGNDPIDVLRCPSDPKATGSREFGGISYFPSNGHSSAVDNGFYSNGRGPNTDRDFPDGQSHTVAFTERQVPPRPETLMDVFPNDRAFWQLRGLRRTSVFHADYDAFADECEYRSDDPLTGTIHVVNYVTHIQTPNRNSCTNRTRNDPRSFEHAAFTATSFHPGGVSAAMVDGSAHFINEAIDRKVWRELGTRAGRETDHRFQ